MEPKSKIILASSRGFKETRSTISTSPIKKPIFSQQELESIQKRKEQKQKSIEEKLKEVEITTTEKKSLKRVFSLLSQNKRYFDGKDIARVLKWMEVHLTKSEIDLMIWEVDENLDNKVDKKEFKNMYKRCIIDQSGLEPKSLFNMIQFLMYCKKDKYKVTVEDTLELLYVRLGGADLKEKIRDLFGEEKEKSSIDWEEKQISFSEYLENITKKAIALRKDRLLEKSQMYNNLIVKKTDREEKEDR